MMLLAANIFAADLKVDHITIAGRDLKQLHDQLAAEGILSEYGGKHTNGLTEMAIASFADGSYLELIASQKPTGAPQHYWGKFIDANGGPCAWAVSVPDVSRALPGVHFVKSGRLRPDGVALEWESASIGPEPQGEFFPFFIHDLTPRELRAFPHGKPSVPRYQGVANVVIGVRDLDAAVNRYRRQFQLPEPLRQVDRELGLNLAAFAGTPVILAAPKGSATLTRRLAAFGEAPYAFLLEQAPRTVGGFIGQFSHWFGRDIVWLSSPGADYPWLGVIVPQQRP